MKKGWRRIFLLLVLSTALFQIGQGLSDASGVETEGLESAGRIAVASVGDTPGSKISEIAGRAPYYLLFDESGVFLKAVRNPGQGRGRDSSMEAVELLPKESCKTVIAGRFGNKMRRQLETHNIDYHERTGIAADAVRLFIKARQ
jgi:predicted Fe-Mo cluster-binding NifX family protein